MKVFLAMGIIQVPILTTAPSITSSTGPKAARVRISTAWTPSPNKQMPPRPLDGTFLYVFLPRNRRTVPVRPLPQQGSRSGPPAWMAWQWRSSVVAVSYTHLSWDTKGTISRSRVSSTKARSLGAPTQPYTVEQPSHSPAATRLVWLPFSTRTFRRL